MHPNLLSQSRLSLHLSKYHIDGNDISWIIYHMGLDARNLSWGLTNNTRAYQPAHPRSLISAFVISLLESIICQLGSGEISIFQLASETEDTGLQLAISETPKTGCVAMPLICSLLNYLYTYPPSYIL